MDADVRSERPRQRAGSAPAFAEREREEIGTEQHQQQHERQGEERQRGHHAAHRGARFVG